MGSRGGRRWVSVAAVRPDGCSAGTVAQPTNLILVNFPRIRNQSEPTPCRLSQATVKNLDKFIFIVKGNVLPFSLAQFLERWQLGTFFFSIL